jgi:hypothetical protein
MRNVLRWVGFAVAALAAAACTLNRDGTGDVFSTSGVGAQGPVTSTGGGGTTTTATGGAGGVGGVGGTGGGGGPAVIDEWAAGDPGPTGQYTLPSWLTFESPTTGKTSQTSESTLRTGFGANAPRARRPNASAPWGLSVESTRTNNALNSVSWSGVGWFPGTMMVAANQADPAGGMAATHFTGDPGTLGDYQSALGGVVSTWAIGAAGNSPYACFRHCDWVEVVNPAWTRYAVNCAGSVMTDLNLERRTAPAVSCPAPSAGPTTTGVYGLQVEGGSYASSYIPTTNAPATRAVERLYVNDPPTYFPGGRFHVTMVVAPFYGSGQLPQSANHDLLFFDSLNRVYIERMAANTRVCMAVAGSALCTSAVSWQPDREITINAVSSATGTELDVTIEGQVPLELTGGMGPAVALGPTVHLLGNTLGAQECADLRRVTIYDPQ